MKLWKTQCLSAHFCLDDPALGHPHSISEVLRTERKLYCDIKIDIKRLPDYKIKYKKYQLFVLLTTEVISKLIVFYIISRDYYSQ